MKPCNYRRFGVEQTFGERVCNKFVQFLVIVSLVLGFFVSGTRSAHAGEFVATEEKKLGPTYMEGVVSCDSQEQVIDQARELANAMQQNRSVEQIKGCGMMMGGVPAFVFTIGTLIVHDVELTIIRYETIGQYGNQYGWLANARKISSI